MKINSIIKKNGIGIWSGVLATILSLASLVTGPQNATADCLPPPSGLWHWWLADGNALDNAGTNNGTLAGGVSYAAGEVGTSFNLNGTNGYVSVGSGINPTQFTLSAWIYLTSYNTTNGFSAIITKIHNVPGHYYMNFEFRVESNGRLHLHIPNGSSWPYVESATVLSTNQWYFVTGTYDGSIAKLFINGIQDPNQYSGSYAQDDSSVQIGARLDLDDGNVVVLDGFFAGKIDEVSIFNRALTSSEISAIYAAGNAGMCASPRIINQPQSQVGYWGKSASFGVLATGTAPLSYQWFFGTNQIFGATNTTLVLTNLQFTNAGRYAVVVVNSSGSITSNPAILTVNPAGVSIALYPGVTIDGVVGQTYGIQTTLDLSNTNSWIGVTNLTLNMPTVIWYDSQPASLSTKFYRVLPGPIPIP